MWVNIDWVTLPLFLIDRVHRYRARLVLYYQLQCAKQTLNLQHIHHQLFCSVTLLHKENISNVT